MRPAEPRVVFVDAVVLGRVPGDLGHHPARAKVTRDFGVVGGCREVDCDNAEHEKYVVTARRRYENSEAEYAFAKRKKPSVVRVFVRPRFEQAMAVARKVVKAYDVEDR